jgi:hypothetical protein
VVDRDSTDAAVAVYLFEKAHKIEKDRVSDSLRNGQIEFVIEFERFFIYALMRGV